MTLSLMGIADASVHLHGVSTVQTRLEFVVGSLFEIKVSSSTGRCWPVRLAQLVDVDQAAGQVHG